MAKGFFISKTLGIVGIVLGAAAVATIIALAVVYAQEKASNVLTTTAAATTTTTLPASTAKPNNAWDRLRLPKTLKPEHYTVTLQPFLTPDSQDRYIFKGESTVRFQCLEPTDLILIHSKKLNYTGPGPFHVSLSGVDGVTPPAITRTWTEQVTEYLVVQLDGPLQREKFYELHSVFQGELAPDLAGFYLSKYEEDGQPKVLATTQMQAADARKAFPCFDEPAMKASFSIVLIHWSDHEALSNMPVHSSQQMVLEDGKSWTKTEFEPTLKMSTYLLAFIVSQFTAVEDPQATGPLIRIWGRPKAITAGHGDYALNVTGPILRFFESHYNTTYPLSKADQVALPDFNAGAMENWGLVTYRENSLLFDPFYSSIGNRERVVTVIAHELAHQWFGNLVTLNWWNDLWLNEGFASYVEYLGADAAEPTWNIKDLIVSSDMYRVMAIDALVSSHPLSFPEDEINSPAQISEVFDSIAYSKGASVLRMLSEFLTEDRFKRGLMFYLHAFAYGNTVYNDLWDKLQEVEEESNSTLPGKVKDIMDRWTLQMGFPVLTVDTSTGTITQQHFLLDPNATVVRPSAFNYTWIVPVSWMSSVDVAQMYWLRNKTEINPAFSTAANATTWLLLNINVTGYFRVNYDQGNWDRLMALLNSSHQALPVLNRAQLIDDSFNLARAKHTSTELALNTTRYLAEERDYLPWDAATRNLGYFRLMFDRSEVYGPMQSYIQKQVTPLFNHFKSLTSWTTTPEGLMEQYNQILALSTACSYGIADCQDQATAFFNQWRLNPNANPIIPNLRSAIYCSAISTGGVEAWDFAWERFLNTTVASEADKLRGALACSQEPWILQRYLQYTLEPTKIRRQDATSTINSIAQNVVGQSLVWDFVRANWETLFNQFGGSSFSFSSLILTVTERFASKYELQQLQQFKADYAHVGFGSATRALEQALEKTNANIQWVAENKAPVLQWFNTENL